ncbi:MAG: hypothetical protein KA371_10535 [Acidobacteria bacterium]|nr:hypothetical protein [Acidobacteriota bacterium]
MPRLARSVSALLFTALVGVAQARAQAAPPAGGPAPNALDVAAKTHFLQTARVVRSRSIGQGVTSPWRLTLSDGVVTHDAAFQSIDERKAIANFGPRGQEFNFVDSYHFNLAAYTIAGMLGLADMMPVTAHRDWDGTAGTLTWWIDDAFDERTRLKEHREPPNAMQWRQQMHRIRVFAALVGDTDRNLGNVLITSDWKLWMIDFTRAFRLWTDLKSPADLSQIDRRLLARLRTLDAKALREATLLAPTPMALVDVREVKEIGCERPPFRARTFVQAATQRVAHTHVPDPGASWSRAPTNCSFVNALTYARCRCPTRTALLREVLGMRMMGTYRSQCPASCAPITGAIVGRPSASSSLGALRRPLRGCGLDESCAPPELATT